MKVVVFGASGIIGSHLRLAVPDGVEPIWMRRKEDLLHRGLDLNPENSAQVVEFMKEEKPDVIINLAGESRTDEVERNPMLYYGVNVELPTMLSQWCARGFGHYIHVSTQAVFNGEHPPYHPKSPRNAVNAYGHQKILAEESVERAGSRWTIVRPSFVLGIRPAPSVGRENPMEQMLAASVQKQVSDRWFSVSFARDVAAELWRIALGEPLMKPVHIGIAHGVSRYDLARRASQGVVQSALHEEFPGIAPRPVDTTYADAEGKCSWEGDDYSGALACETPEVEVLQAAFKRAGLIKAGISRCREELGWRNTLSAEQRAREISLFTGLREFDCLAKLMTGFHQLHSEVAADFRRANPQDDDALLLWYMRTPAYLFELSGYHCDAGVPAPGWNYSGMCAGVADRLEAAGAKRVLCLGDGIGDLTMALAKRGFTAFYHDLAGSQTAAFAAMRYWMYLGVPMPTALSSGWEPIFEPESFDSIVSFDFLEHVTSVPEWVSAIRGALRPNGLFCAQNAFGIGSGNTGSIPMHLSRNDRFEKDWDPLLIDTGFSQLSSNWYQKTVPLGPSPHPAVPHPATPNPDAPFQTEP